MVAGKVTLLGKPLAGIKVIANQQYRFGGSPKSAFSRSGRDGSFAGLLVPKTYWFQVILDYQQAKLVEGTYLRINNGEATVKTGSEQELIEFSFVEPVQLNSPSPGSLYRGGPLKIAWEPYPGAYEYAIDIETTWLGEDNNHRVYCWRDYIKTTGTDCLVEFLNPYFYSYAFDQIGIAPESYFNLLDISDLVEVKVKALDQEGNIISSSESLIFDEDLPVPGQMIVEDSLKHPVKEMLFERKYDEALAYLEEAVKANPADEELLWILARMYFFGTHNIQRDEGYFEISQREFKKAYWVLKHLEEISPGEEVNKALETVRTWLFMSILN